MRKAPRYLYALDEHENLIHIDNAVKDKNVKYYCPNCKAPLTPKKGKKKRWHFAHKSDKCSLETYLHKIAKKLFKEFFYNKNVSSINITIPQTQICPTDKCPISRANSCQFTQPIVFNLKEHYDSCEEETRIEKFTADLLLKNHENSNQPVLIEFYVSHECSSEKVESGLPIIEIKIGSIEDLHNIINVLTGVRKSDSLKNNTIRIYNFNQVILKKIPKEYQQQKHLWVLTPDGKYHRTFEPVICTAKIEFEYAVLIESSKPISNDFAMLILNKYHIRHCLLCYHRYSSERFKPCYPYGKLLNCPHHIETNYKPFINSHSNNYENQDYTISINTNILPKQRTK